jgi:hypothetical protein
MGAGVRARRGSSTSPEMIQRYTDAGMVIRASFGQLHPPADAGGAARRGFGGFRRLDTETRE